MFLQTLVWRFLPFFSIFTVLGLNLTKNFTELFLISQPVLYGVIPLLYKIFSVSSSYKNRQKFWGLYCKYESQIPFSTSLCNLDTAVPPQWTSHLQPMPWLKMIFLRAKWQIIAGNAMQLTIKSIQQNEEGMLKARVFPCSCCDLAHIRYVYVFKEWKTFDWIVRYLPSVIMMLCRKTEKAAIAPSGGIIFSRSIPILSGLSHLAVELEKTWP